MRKSIAILIVLGIAACKKKVEPVINVPNSYVYKTSGAFEGIYLSKVNSMTSKDTVRLIFSKDNHPLGTIKYRIIGIEKAFDDWGTYTTTTNKDYYIDIDEAAKSGSLKDTLNIKIVQGGLQASYNSRGTYTPYLSFMQLK